MKTIHHLYATLIRYNRYLNRLQAIEEWRQVKEYGFVCNGV